jgi:hypothetical protein
MSKIIGNILIDIIPGKHLWKLKLFTHWNSIIGNLNGKVRIEKIHDHTLVLGVCHATWAQELFFLMPMMKKKINKLLKEERIKKIQYRVVRFSGDPRTPRSSRVEGRGRPEVREKITEHCLTISEHSSLQSLENIDLAQALENFCIKCKQNKTYRKKGSKYGKK